MQRFRSLFSPKNSDKIIDVGGTAYNWQFIPEQPAILLVNVKNNVRAGSNIVAVEGDGTQLQYPDLSFDIVYSNSVIEHVGDWNKIQSFADEVRRLAPRYFVQTPYAYFPIEPHLLTAFIHMLPRSLYARLAYRLSIWKYAFDADRKRVAAEIEKINLLNLKQMRELFPDATIRFEYFMGLPKSIIAYRLASDSA